jgi:DNA-binding PadR family transcriptional regulator
MKKSASTLEFAILGLLSRQPQSGYDLRKAFATNLRYYSDSPGSVYPALRRLEARRRIAVADPPRRTANSRGRQTFRLTDAGKAALLAWLKQPAGKDASRNLSELMLRFAFMDLNVPRSTTLRFLNELGDALATRAKELRQRYKAMSSRMKVNTGLLSFEAWIVSVEGYVRWARRAHGRLSGKSQRVS